jgi:hypothetical protein
MFTAYVLVCSIGLTADLNRCTLDSALASIPLRQTFAREATCEREAAAMVNIAGAIVVVDHVLKIACVAQ